MARLEHDVLCGGASAGRIGAGVHHLNLHGPKQNVRLRVQDISKRLLRNIPDHLADLLEVASYARPRAAQGRSWAASNATLPISGTLHTRPRPELC
jgi:hypothetical protein